jgi:hypothetical protein
MGLRQMVLGIAAAAGLGSGWFASSSWARATEDVPLVPFGWDYTPGRSPNGSARSAGGRAHRRWRKRRASGRA